MLLEHKSYPDPLTAFQLLRYLVRIGERDVRQSAGLRPIVPVVMYHGRERWRVATNLAGLFTGDEALRPYWPTLAYELQDLSRLSDKEVQGAAQLQIGLLVLKYIFDPALRGRLADILNLFHDLAETETALEYLGTVLYYISRASTHLAPDEMVTVVQRTLADKGSEAMQTVADYWIEQGIEKGIEQGIKKGRVQTLHEDILDLLNIRFGPAAPEVTGMVTAVTDVDALRQLLREAATAATMAAFTQTLNAS